MIAMVMAGFAGAAYRMLPCRTPAAEPSGEMVELPPKERFHLFLLAGQSNMAGRGEVEEQDRAPHPRVLALDGQGRWVPAVDPLHFDKPSIAGVGLGRTFGIEIAERYPEITVGLIPCATGGSPITMWEPGAYWEQTDSNPWDDAMQRAELALEAGTLKAILWHQGESDAQPGEAEQYEERLHDLIRRFRAEFSADKLPFIAGQLGQFAGRPWGEPAQIVNAAHESLPSRIPHTAFVASDGLTDKGDDMHFDSPSLREFGRRYAEAYLAVAERDS